MRLLLCPLDLEAQFSRSNREYLGDAPLSSGPNSAEGVTLVLSVEKGKKKSVAFHREKMPAQSIDHWESKCYTFSSFPFHQTKYHSSSFRNRSVSLLSNLSPSTRKFLLLARGKLVVKSLLMQCLTLALLV